MGNPSKLFTDIIEALLQGKVICEYTEEDAYKELQNPSYLNEVDTYLGQIGRRIKSTQDMVGFYAAYTTLDKAEYRASVKSQFTETINNLEPLVRWLHLAISSSHMDRPLSAGDVLKLSVLLEAIESAPILCEELDTLSRTRFFSNTQSTPKGQMDSVMRKLVEQGYLVSNSKVGTQFIATGKWSRLYDLMEFISSHEQIGQDESENQRKLVL